MEPRQRIRAFITENYFVEGFEDEVSFLRSGIVDSTGMGELVAFLETEFGITVSEDELVPANLDSLDRVVAFLERKRRSAA